MNHKNPVLAALLCASLLFAFLVGEHTVRAPVYGRDFPAGFQLAFAASTAFELFGDDES